MKKEHNLFLVYPLISSKVDKSRIYPGKPVYFSNKAKAEQMAKTFKDHFGFLYDEVIQEEKVYCIIIEEYEMDTPYRYQLSTLVYDCDGILLNDSNTPDEGPFLGRDKTEIKYTIGDFVEIPCGEKLIVGIVAEQPLSMCEIESDYSLNASDDCYTIIQHPDHEINYAHTPLVFKPSIDINEVIKDDLKNALIRFKQNS